MVTIKIQSQSDVIRAYLETLGFNSDKAQKSALKLEQLFDNTIKNGEEIIAELDKRLLGAARKVWPLSEYESEQLVALFKLIYLINEGAQRWGDVVFYDEDVSEDLRKAMISHSISQAPNYSFVQMQPQKIEPVSPKNWLKRLLHFSSKKAS